MGVRRLVGLWACVRLLGRKRFGQRPQNLLLLCEELGDDSHLRVHLRVQLVGEALLLLVQLAHEGIVFPVQLLVLLVHLPGAGGVQRLVEAHGHRVLVAPLLLGELRQPGEQLGGHERSEVARDEMHDPSVGVLLGPPEHLL